MKIVVADLVDFVENKTIGDSLAAVVKKVGEVEMRIVAIHLLSRLKEWARSAKHKPFAFNTKHSWCQNFLILLSSVRELGELFEVDGNRVEFRSGVSEEERAKTLKYVEVHYKPKLSVYLKPSRDRSS